MLGEVELDNMTDVFKAIAILNGSKAGKVLTSNNHRFLFSIGERSARERLF